MPVLVYMLQAWTSNEVFQQHFVVPTLGVTQVNDPVGRNINTRGVGQTFISGNTAISYWCWAFTFLICDRA